MRKVLGCAAFVAPAVVMAQTTVPPDPELDGQPWADGTLLFVALVAVLFWALFAKSGVFYKWAEDHSVLAWIALIAVPATITFILT